MKAYNFLRRPVVIARMEAARMEIAELERRNTEISEPITKDIQKVNPRITFTQAVRDQALYTPALSHVLLDHFRLQYPSNIKDGMISWWRSVQVEDREVADELLKVFRSLPSEIVTDLEYISGRKYQIAAALAASATTEHIDIVLRLMKSGEHGQDVIPLVYFLGKFYDHDAQAKTALNRMAKGRGSLSAKAKAAIRGKGLFPGSKIVRNRKTRSATTK